MKKKKNPAIIIVPIVIIVVIIGLVAINSINSKNVDKTFVTVELAKKDNVVSSVNSTGTISSETNVDYISPVNAEIETVNVTVGQVVKAGDYIVSYDTVQLQKAYDLATLQNLSQQATTNDTINASNNSAQKVNEAQAKIDDYNSKINTKNNEINALKDELNNQELAEDIKYYKNEELQKKYSELEEYKMELESAKAEKSAAEAGVMSNEQRQSLDYNMQVSGFSVTDAENELNIAKAGLVAESDGIVIAVNTANGAMAAQGQTLVTIAKISDMKVDFTVSKYNLEKITVGQKVTIKSLGHEYTGSVSKISKVAVTSETGLTSTTTSTAMVAAEVHIDTPDDNLIIGMDADITINTGEANDVVTVLSSAINEDKKGKFVYICNNGKIVRKDVVTGISSDTVTEIKEGVSEDDAVVTVVDLTISEGMEAETIIAKK